ncbi:glycosyltransferase family 4 protein [Algoriphagus namhaensis]|uniref:Glycosyltransferase family 4 protein n=1 Tax=Algoriphagus namhaensis TaxID=915353 RepID=A0ABV8ATC2_9BACT
MKVFFTQDTLINAGTEKSLLFTIPYFSKEISCTVIYLYSRHDLKEAYEKAGIPVIFLNLEGKYGFLSGYKKLSKLLREETPDLVVSSLFRANILSRFVCKSLSIPLIGTLVSDSYSEIVLKKKSFFQLQKFKFFWGLDRFTAGIPNLYIANSSFIAKSHIKTLGVPIEKTKVVYRGRNIPSQVWKKSAADTFEFLSFGRLLQIKGFEELIQAFAKVHSKYPNSRLVIYGEGLHRPILERLIKELNLTHSVSLPGVIPNVTEMLYQADCFVFPSWYEGFSGALVEAMMAGIPIIASDIPMNLEAVNPEENALTFPVRDVKALIQKMEYAITHQNEMAELGKNARREACRRFDIQVIAKQYEAVLREAYLKYAAH